MFLGRVEEGAIFLSLIRCRIDPIHGAILDGYPDSECIIIGESIEA
jgi:hypothetical protein